VGNQNAQGSLGAGAVVNSGALVFARSDAVTAANPISGAGTLTQNGTGILTLSGDSTFTGPTIVASGTLRAGSARAFGAVDGATIVNAGTTLDVNGQNLGAEPVTVAGSGATGNGAVINNGGAQLNALRAVTLAGNTTFGGTARWDIRQADGSATLLTGGAAHKITKIGSNQVSLVGLSAVDAAFGDIEIQEGIFSVQTTTVQLGDASRTVTVYGGATLGFFNLNPSPLNKQIVLRDGAVVFNENGNSGISGPMELEGNSTFNVANAATLTISSDMSGAGGLTKIGAGALVLNGAFIDHNGPTTVSNGTLFVNGSLFSQSPVVVHGGTLAGMGNVAGAVTIGPNGNLAPGDAPGTTASIELESSVSLAGTCTIDINKSLVFANDLVAFVNNLSLGGILRVNVAGPALVAGDAFIIFGFTSASGAFNQIQPASPGPGLAWDTSSLTADGTLRVVELRRPGIAEISFTENGVVWNGTNGVGGDAVCCIELDRHRVAGGQLDPGDDQLL
jgi:autotransporter-associated beta strand protein